MNVHVVYVFAETARRHPFYVATLCDAIINRFCCSHVRARGVFVQRDGQRDSDDLDGYLVFYKTEVKRLKILNPREPIHFMAVRIR